MNKRLDLKEDFKSYLEDLSKVSSTSNYNYGNTNYKERCDVFFYEWSDLTAIPKRFNNSKEFFKFLEECKISITEGMKKEFDDRYTFYASCFKNSNILALSSSKYQLEQLLKKVAESDTIPTEDKDRCSFYTSYPNYHGGGGYMPGCYGYEQGCYEDWD